MRKYLIVAVAALTALAFTTVALAQTGGQEATMKVTVKPKKAGTKKKPKNSSIDLFIANNNDQRTLSELDITAPKTFKLSAKGLTKCSIATLESGGPAACPKGSKVGGGEANALLGVGGTNPQPLHFDVQAIITGSKNIAFHLHSDNPSLDLVSPGTINGRHLRIEVPQNAQQPIPGVYAGLVDIHTTLKGKKGKKYLASTVGCKKKKHPFSTKLTFIDNGHAPAGTVRVKASSKCS